MDTQTETPAIIREPTTSLRFTPRRDRMILQQRFRITTATDVRYVWTDVPVESDDDANHHGR